MMHINTDIFTPFGLFKSPAFAAADEGGAGSSDASGDAGDTSNTDDTDQTLGGNSDEAGSESQTEGTVLGGDDAGESSDAAGQDTDDKEGEGEGTDGDSDDEGNTVPEDGVYSFDVPDTVEIDDAAKASWSEVFKGLELTQSQAAKLVEAQVANAVAEGEAMTKALSDMQTAHIKDAKADPEIGGDKWAESTKLANNALALLRGGPKGDPEAKNDKGENAGFKQEGALEALILSSGNGNNPEIIRELRRIGMKFADDTFTNGSNHEEPKAKSESWYEGTTPKTKQG